MQKDESEAAKWFTKAADKGEPRSQFYLAECYERGQGVKNDPEIAFSWMQKAAAQNYAQAEVKLATYYANGIGTKQDLAEAIKLYQKGSKRLIEILQDINPRD